MRAYDGKPKGSSLFSSLLLLSHVSLCGHLFCRFSDVNRQSNVGLMSLRHFHEKHLIYGPQSFEYLDSSP